MTERRMLAAIMFTDIEGYTGMMSRRENVALANLKMHNKVFDELSFKYSGLVVKSIGDSYLIEFPSAVNAVQCAFEAQKTFAECDVGGPDGDRLKVRISIHVGDVIADNDDVYGDGVNIASRLQTVTPGGGVCLSGEAFSQVKTRFRDRFVSLGSKMLRGLSEPVDVFISRDSAPAALVSGGDRKVALNVVVPEASLVRPVEEPSGPDVRPLSQDERRAAAARAAALPAPPPAPAPGPPGPTAASWVIFGAFFLLFFGGRWIDVRQADWLGCGWASALVACALMFYRGRGSLLTLGGLVLIADVAVSFYLLGEGPAGGWPSFEVGLGGGVGLAGAAAGGYLGYFDPQPDHRLAAGLLAASAFLLMLAGCARVLPEGMPWSAGIPQYLAAQLDTLGATGGAWRWGGFAVALAAWKIAGASSYDPETWSRAVGEDGRKLNWNR